jgi:hypothetical protein
MRMQGGSGRSVLFSALLLLLLLPNSAVAATVVNGDFESGALNGWNVHRVTQAGNWFAYKGTDAPIGHKRDADPVQAPPQGAHAAVADEANPDTLILYQDIALEPGLSHRLSLLTYYNTYRPIAIPTPDTLSVDFETLAGQKNQQYRIDVMRPEAPIESIDPAGVLLNLFRTEAGSPARMSPTRLTADLSPFAGQTVRLRIALAAHEEVLNAGVDDVSIDSTRPGQSPSRGSKPHGSSRLSVGKAKANLRNGTVTLLVQVPGAGRLTAKGGGGPKASSARASGAGKAGGSIKPVTLRIKAAGTVSVRLKLARPAFKALKQKHKLRVKVAVSYTPTGGSPETATVPVVFRLKG